MRNNNCVSIPAEGYYTAPFTLDSLTTMAQFSARLDSLANL